MDEVLALMEQEENLEIDDSQEVILEGSGEEFDDMEDIENLENCTVIFNYVSMYYYLLSCRYGL